jgi:hypothetical protein
MPTNISCAVAACYCESFAIRYLRSTSRAWNEFDVLEVALRAGGEGIQSTDGVVRLISSVAAQQQICAVMTKETAGMFRAG